MLFVHTRNPEEMRVVGERLPPPPEVNFRIYDQSLNFVHDLGSRFAEKLLTEISVILCHLSLFSTLYINIVPVDQHSLLSNIGLAFTVATLFAFIAKALKQPLLLGYLIAGVVIGPEIGFAWVKDEEAIELISEIGLILLLFIIGLEIDLKKLLSAGQTILISGISQFLLCAFMGIGFAFLMGFRPGSGNFDWLYVAVTLALSSTLIVVKLLYDKFELTTLPGQITLGVLVFQDIWAILFLALQPNLHDPHLGAFFGSFGKGAGLVFLTLALSRYVLPWLFSFVAKIPELLLLAAIAWCFLVSGAADVMGLSREMGALIAGVSMSTFPYNVDVIAKVINIRDFFVTLFFVALGMQIPHPSLSVVTAAIGMSIFRARQPFALGFPGALRAGQRLTRKPDPFHQPRSNERVFTGDRFLGTGPQSHQSRVGRSADLRFRHHFRAVDVPDRLQS